MEGCYGLDALLLEVVVVFLGSVAPVVLEVLMRTGSISPPENQIGPVSGLGESVPNSKNWKPASEWESDCSRTNYS